MNRNKKVLILTSVHRPFDTRIYKREALTLAKAGYHVALIATDTASQYTDEGIKIVSNGKPRWRLGRMLKWVDF